jgi:hypothetical protein
LKDGMRRGSPHARILRWGLNSSLFVIEDDRKVKVWISILSLLDINQFGAMVSRPVKS